MKKQLIGKGSFTKCYLNEDKLTVTLISTDYIKECMSLNWFPADLGLFPDVILNDAISNDAISNDDKSYTMKYYPRVTSLKKALNPRDFKLYQCLRKLNIPTDYRNNIHDNYSKWRKEFSTIPDEFKEEREEIIGALDSCINYGSDIGFEISPRNVATDNGKLILLDCFFMVTQIMRIREEKSKRRY